MIGGPDAGTTGEVKIFDPEEVSVREAGPDLPYLWDLTVPLTYTPPRDPTRDPQVDVALPFRTDFASIPWIFTWLFPRYGKYTKADPGPALDEAYSAFQPYWQLGPVKAPDVQAVLQYSSNPAAASFNAASIIDNSIVEGLT